ncbi:MAG: LysR family transcriptional regulator [Streptosporangiales bacterium]|nr:LysR family transcriptional regulator [Streptosporangiales bacterium]
MIDVHRLGVLREVSKHGSLAGAARTLHLTPSAVSQHVAALERSVGTTVIERSTRGVRLTAAGQLLVETADTVAGELSETERRLSQLIDGHAGRLAIATFSSAGQGFLPPALLPMAARQDVDIRAIEAEPAPTVELLRSGEADVALVYHFRTKTPPRKWRDLRYVPLVEDHVRAVLPAHHPLTERDEIRLADLTDEWWVHGWGECGEAMEQAAGYEPKVACRGSDYFFIQTMVAAGIGVALIPDVALGIVLDQVEIRAVRPAPVRYIGALLPAGRRTSPLTEELIERLQGATADGTTRAVRTGRTTRR